MQFRFDVTYYFGCSTCNSGPFFFKIIAIKAYLQGVHRSGLNQFSFIGFFCFFCFCFFFFYRKVKLQLKVQFFLVIVRSQSSFFQVNRTRLLITTPRAQTTCLCANSWGSRHGHVSSPPPVILGVGSSVMAWLVSLFPIPKLYT